MSDPHSIAVSQARLHPRHTELNLSALKAALPLVLQLACIRHENPVIWSQNMSNIMTGNKTQLQPLNDANGVSATAGLKKKKKYSSNYS